MSYAAWSPLLPGGAELLTELQVFSVTDSCSVICAEPGNYATSWQTRDDDTAILVDALNTATARQVTATDSLAIQVSDVGHASVILTVSDTCAVQATDAAASPIASVTVSDSATVQAVEPASEGIFWNVNDAVVTVASETTAAPALLTTLESCAVQASESSPAIVAVLAVSDTCAVQSSDATPAIVVSLSVSDACTIRAVDAYQPFPVTSVLDTFNRANEGPPPSSSWSNAFQASLQVVGNELVGGDIANEGAAGWNTALPSTDLEVFTTIGSVALTNNGGPFALLFRMQVPNDYLQDHYRLKVQNAGGLGFIEIVRFQSSSGTSVGFSYLSGLIAVGDQIGVSVIGSIFRVYWNGTLVLTYADAGITTGTYVGLWVITGLATTFDNFGGGASAVGGASIISLVSVTDSVAVPTSDAVSITDAQTLSETAAIGATDAISTIVAVLTASDSCAMQASDNSLFLSAMVVASDSAAVQALEGNASVLSTVSIADSHGLASTESVLVAVSASADDSLAVSLDESPNIAVTASASDTCTVQAVESTSIVAALSVEDSLSPQAAESIPTIDTGDALVAKGPFADTCVVLVSDDSVFISATVSASDSVTIQASEGDASIISTVSASDSAGLGSSESVFMFVQASVADSASIDASELATVAVLVVVTDSASASLAESTNIVQLSLFGVTDSCATLASESVLVAISLSTTDSDAITASESVQSGPQPVNAYEMLTLTEDEGVGIAVTQPASDAVSGSIVEDVIARVTLSVSDAVTEGLTDIITFAGEPPSILYFTVADAASVQADDRALSPKLPAELVAMLLLESVRVDKTDLQTYWGGGMLGEPASQIYATSVRTGPLPPDQSRGGTW